MEKRDRDLGLFALVLTDIAHALPIEPPGCPATSLLILIDSHEQASYMDKSLLCFSKRQHYQVTELFICL